MCASFIGHTQDVCYIRWVYCKTKCSKFSECVTWMKHEILMEMTTKISVFSNVTVCSVVEMYRGFRSILPLTSSVQMDEFTSLF